MIFQFPPDALVEVLTYACRAPRNDPPGCDNWRGVVVAFDVRGDERIKTLDAAMTNSFDFLTGDFTYQQRLRDRSWGPVGFAVVDAHGMTLADGCGITTDILRAMGNGDLWATIRAGGVADGLCETMAIMIGDVQFVGAVADPEMLPDTPGVLIVIDRVGELDAPIAVEAATNLQATAANPCLLNHYAHRLVGEPRFAYVVTPDRDEYARGALRDMTAHLLFGSGMTL